MSLELGPQQIAWIVQTGVVALVGWLLKRAISGLDESIRDMRAGLKALDTTDRDQAKQLLELNIQLKYAQEAIHELKDSLARANEKQEQFGKFLSWKFGFKRHLDPKPEPTP